jgi:hypothetical protein
MEAGLVASLFSAPIMGVSVSIVSGGLLTMLAAGYVAARARSVREYQPPG